MYGIASLVSLARNDMVTRRGLLRYALVIARGLAPVAISFFEYVK